MASLDEDMERDMIDFMTQSMFSMAFLDTVSREIFSQKDVNPVRDFHKNWNDLVSPKELKVPMSPGIFVAHICMCFLLPRQHWLDLLPDVDINSAPPEWGFSQYSKIVDSHAQVISVKHAIRRMRNAFCHGNVKINVPEQGLTLDNLFDRTTIALRDVDVRSPNKTFDCTASLNSLLLTVKAMQSIAHTNITQKYRITKPA